MEDRSFTDKQVYAFVFVVVVTIAFLETSDPIGSEAFWKEFGLNVIVYAAAAEIAAIAWARIASKD